MNINQEIPIFFSCDDNYVPYLAVAIRSLIDHTTQNNIYRIIILNTGINESNQKKLKFMETKNVKISFENISKSLQNIDNELKFRLRDYYSIAIYYRLFIPSLFPMYEKAIYLDADMIILNDVAKLYEMDMGDNLLIATTDSTVNDTEIFKKYSKVALGIEPQKYINSGMLVMNLRGMRQEKLEKKFIYLLLKYNLEVIAPDQDYLNVLCKDRIKYINETWDKMPDFGKKIPQNDLHIIHYNMTRKPWHYDDVPYSDVFWQYAKKTEFCDSLKKEFISYTDEQRNSDQIVIKNLTNLANKIINQDVKIIDVIHETDFFETNKTDSEGSFTNMGEVLT